MKDKIKLYQNKLDTLLQENVIDFDNELTNNLPTSSGIYRIFEKNTKNNTTVYLGKSKNLRRRINSNHYRGSLNNSTLRRKLSNVLSNDKITQFLEQKCCIQFIEIEEKALSNFEHYFIALLSPTYND